MKSYEESYKMVLPSNGYYILRADGRAFHTFTSRFGRPWDTRIRAAMDQTTMALCKDIAGSAFAYTQSDEISVLFVAGQQEKTEPHFGGVVQKIVSTAAATATLTFNCALDKVDPEYEINNFVPTFDARVFHLPSADEVANYFIWRQRDAIRNSIQAAARSVASHKECQGKRAVDLKQLYLAKTGKRWEDIDMGERQGYVAIKVEHPFEDYIRHSWEVHQALEFRPYWQENYFMNIQIPRLLVDAHTN
jgi:tRNA(His) 5'-end guanylyltransferase